MYVMEHALHQKSAAIVFALAVVLVSFGMGSSVQSHSIAAAVNEHWTIDPKVIGILLGGTMGRDNLYIDLLLYDAPAFMEQASSLLGQYSYPFYLAEFRPESRLVALANVG